MIGTDLLAQNAIWGCSLLGCCCPTKSGGKQFPDEPTLSIDPQREPNPFVSFTPVPTAPTSELDPVGVVTVPPMHDPSQRDILHTIAAERRLPADVLSVGIPDKVTVSRVDFALRNAFQQLLRQEEYEFLALILASED